MVRQIRHSVQGNIIIIKKVKWARESIIAHAKCALYREFVEQRGSNDFSILIAEIQEVFRTKVQAVQCMIYCRHSSRRHEGHAPRATVRPVVKRASVQFYACRACMKQNITVLFSFLLIAALIHGGKSLGIKRANKTIK